MVAIGRLSRAFRHCVDTVTLPRVQIDLYSSSRAGDTDRIREALSNGAEINRCNSFGNSALHLLALGGHWETDARMLLVDNGADEHRLNHKGQTPYEVAVRARLLSKLHDLSENEGGPQAKDLKRFARDLGLN
ncbi:MAG: ankyrin repeat domain-containing protein [Chromatiaceae bacterium]|nr:ankyrin repeat domain-containing protein [Chromatiaceae bacterium]